MSCFPLRFPSIFRPSFLPPSKPEVTIHFPQKPLQALTPIVPPQPLDIHQYVADIIQTTDDQLYTRLESRRLIVNRESQGMIAIKALSGLLDQEHTRETAKKYIVSLLSNQIRPAHPMWKLIVNLYGKSDHSACSDYLAGFAKRDFGNIDLDDFRLIFNCLVTQYNVTRNQLYFNAIQSVWNHYKAQPYRCPDRGWVVAELLLINQHLGFYDDVRTFLMDQLPHYSQPTLLRFDWFFNKIFNLRIPATVADELIQKQSEHLMTSKLLSYMIKKGSIREWKAMLTQCRDLDTRQNILLTIFEGLKKNPSDSLEAECVQWIANMATSPPISFDHIECVLRCLCDFHQQMHESGKESLGKKIEETIRLICSYYINRLEPRSEQKCRSSDGLNDMSGNSILFIKHKLYEFLNSMHMNSHASLQPLLRGLVLQMETQSNISFSCIKVRTPAELPNQLDSAQASHFFTYSFFESHQSNWGEWKSYLNKQILTDDIKHKIADEANRRLIGDPDNLSIQYSATIIDYLGRDFIIQNQHQFSQLYYQLIVREAICNREIFLGC